MSDLTPNSLEPIKKVDVARMSKWPLYAVLLAGLFLLGVLVYSVNFAHNQDTEQSGTPKVEIKEQEKPLLMGEGRGLALAPPTGSPALMQPDMSAQNGAKREPLIVVQSDKSQSDNYRQELENLRRMKAQAQLTALSAPLGVQKASQTNTAPVAYTGSNSGPDKPPLTLLADPYGVRESSYDPAADKDKEAFFDRAGKDSTWILPHTRTAGQKFEVKTGAVIPGVMVTGINSDLPGQVMAQVSQNVWDTATGRFLLIPQGTRLIGAYSSDVAYGQERVLMAWQRLIFPDGKVLDIHAMPGADSAGYAGFSDKVNSHWFRTISSAFLMSGVIAAADMSQNDGNSNSNNDRQRASDALSEALGQTLGQTLGQIISKNLNVAPTLEIRPGYRFNVMVIKDMTLPGPYQAFAY